MILFRTLLFCAALAIPQVAHTAELQRPYICKEWSEVARKFTSVYITNPNSPPITTEDMGNWKVLVAWLDGWSNGYYVARRV
jgi:hypothetical protein